MATLSAVVGLIAGAAALVPFLYDRIETPLATPPPTATATATPTATATATPTATATATPTATATVTATATATATETSTLTDGDGGLELPAVVGLGLVGSLALGLTAEGFRRLLVLRNRRRREELDALIKKHAGADSEELRRIVKAAEPVHEDVALKQVETYLLDEGPELRGVEQVILRHPPPLPRAAKRMLNHARLLTRIANERGMFGGEPPLEPAHLGKWIVLAERWPAVARGVMREPDALARLEATLLESRDLAAAAKASDLDVPASSDLRELVCEPPQLSPVIGRLIHFDRAPV